MLALAVLQTIPAYEVEVVLEIEVVLLGDGEVELLLLAAVVVVFDHVARLR